MEQTQYDGLVGLSGRETHLLKALVIEGTLARAADVVGVSDRHCRRLLRNLERQLGVRNLHALVAWAANHDVVTSEHIYVRS